MRGNAEHARVLVDLQRVAANVTRLDRMISTAAKRRDAMIRRAVAAGIPHKDIAAAAGITRGRVGQIAVAHDEKGKP